MIPRVVPAERGQSVPEERTERASRHSIAVLIVGQLRGFRLSQTLEQYVTAPWSSVRGWDHDVFVCSDAPTKFSKETLVKFKIAAEWAFNVDSVMSKLKQGIGKLPDYGHNSYFRDKYIMHSTPVSVSAQCVSSPMRKRMQNRTVGLSACDQM